MKILVILFFLLFVFAEAYGMELSIDEAVDYALKYNLELKAKREEIKIVKGNLNTALTYPFNPEISLEGRGLLSTGDEVKTSYKFGERNEYTLYLSQTFETGGQKGIRKDIASTNMEAVQFEIADVERILTGEVKREFYNLTTLENKLKQADLSVDLSQKILDIAERRFRSGDVPKMDVNLARVELKGKETERIRTIGLLSIARVRMNSLLGLPSDSEIILKDSSKGLNSLHGLNSLKELKEIAINGRPDLHSLEAKVSIADKEVSLSTAEVSPNVRVSILYNRDYDKEVYGAGMSIPIPVINRNRGQVESLTAQKIRLNNQRESLKLLIAKEVESAYLMLNSAKRGVEQFENEILPQLRENVEVLKRAYDAGRIGIYTVILEQQKLISNTNLYYDSLYEYKAAVVDLEVAIGGGRK
ncbi:MAG: TolC family protein [Nitrospinae bacterium]|nr:TolC family protein [Nitrospinota bacterium]